MVVQPFMLDPFGGDAKIVEEKENSSHEMPIMHYFILCLYSPFTNMVVLKQMKSRLRYAFEIES